MGRGTCVPTAGTARPAAASAAAPPSPPSLSSPKAAGFETTALSMSRSLGSGDVSGNGIRRGWACQGQSCAGVCTAVVAGAVDRAVVGTSSPPAASASGLRCIACSSCALSQKPAHQFVNKGCDGSGRRPSHQDISSLRGACAGAAASAAPLAEATTYATPLFAAPALRREDAAQATRAEARAVSSRSRSSAKRPRAPSQGAGSLLFIALVGHAVPQGRHFVRSPTEFGARGSKPHTRGYEEFE